MTALKSSGELKVRADGSTEVRASVYLDGGAWIQCSTYPDRAPVLSITSGPVDVSVGVPDCQHVTAEDVARARQLAAAVAEFVADLERCAVIEDQAPDSAGQAA
jgi:hypothetical protein